MLRREGSTGSSDAGPSGDRVLVVDDHSDLRDMLCAFIEQHGYGCRWAHSAEEALRVLADWRPTLVFIEPELRDGTGRGLSHRLRDRAREQRQSLRIVAYSHFHDCRDVVRSEAVDECLMKPAASATLESTMRKYLAAQPN